MLLTVSEYTSVPSFLITTAGVASTIITVIS